MKKTVAIISIIVAGVLAIAISFSQSFKATTTPSCNKEVTIGQHHPMWFAAETATAVSSAAYSISAFSLPASFNIQTHLPSCFLFEIFGLTDHHDDGHYVEEASLFPDNFFEVTFTLIISPNAP